MAAGGQRPPGQSGMGFFSDAATSVLGLALDGPQALAGKRKIDTLTATDNAKAQKLQPHMVTSVMAMEHSQRSHTPEPVKRDNKVVWSEDPYLGDLKYPGGDKRREGTGLYSLRGPGPYYEYPMGEREWAVVPPTAPPPPLPNITDTLTWAESIAPIVQGQVDDDDATWEYASVSTEYSSHANWHTEL